VACRSERSVWADCVEQVVGFGALVRAIRVPESRVQRRAQFTCPVAGWIDFSFASFRRFWAVAARVNSSLTPQGPRNRRRPKPRNQSTDNQTSRGFRRNQPKPDALQILRARKNSSLQPSYDRRFTLGNPRAGATGDAGADLHVFLAPFTISSGPRRKRPFSADIGAGHLIAPVGFDPDH